MAIRCGRPLEACEAERRGNREHVLKGPEEMAALHGDVPDAVAETARLAAALPVRPDPRPRLSLPHRRTTPTASCRASASHALHERYRRELAARGRLLSPRRGARADRPPPAGRLLPAASRDPRARAGDRRRGARAERRPAGAAARTRARLLGRLDRLLPDGPLARRPRGGPALARTLPQPRDGLRAGHRPRLPARRAREADPRGARALRPRSIGADRRVRHLPLARRDPRARQGARIARGRPRPSGPRLRRPRPRRPSAPRWRACPAWPSGPTIDASARSRSWPPRSPGCRATSRSTRAGWSSRPGRLDELVPLVPAAMEGRQICQWDKDSCADAGFLKIDLLGLGMLSAVEECVDQIARHTGETIDLSRIPLDDPEVYAEIQDADTVGTFQIESRAQMQMLLRTRPEIAGRSDRRGRARAPRADPGRRRPPLPGIGARRCGTTRRYQIPYDHPLLEEALLDTLGVIVYQDQVLDVAAGARRLHAGTGGGPASRDEPPAIARGARRALALVPRRRGRTRRGRGDREPGLREDPRVLRLRLPQVPRRRVRAARLPERVAAPPPPRRLPVRAPERPAAWASTRPRRWCATACAAASRCGAWT